MMTMNSRSAVNHIRRRMVLVAKPTLQYAYRHNSLHSGHLQQAPQQSYTIIFSDNLHKSSHNTTEYNGDFTFVVLWNDGANWALSSLATSRRTKSATIVYDVVTAVYVTKPAWSSLLYCGFKHIWPSRPELAEFQTQWQLKINGQPADGVDEFCYLGSVATNTSSCDEEIRTRIGKANSAFKQETWLHLTTKESRTDSQDSTVWIHRFGHPTVLCRNVVRGRSSPEALGSLPPYLSEKTAKCYMEVQGEKWNSTGYHRTRYVGHST